jgi:hypothetical protein
MSSYKELEIYKFAYDIAIRVHKASLKLPQFESPRAHSSLLAAESVSIKNLP